MTLGKAAYLALDIAAFLVLTEDRPIGAMMRCRNGVRD